MAETAGGHRRRERSETVTAREAAFGFDAENPGRAKHAWAAARIAIGWIFLWAFLDKAFGLGFSTPRDSAYVAGGSPTYGFLTFGTRGPLAPYFAELAGLWWVDALFMIGLLLIGLALLLGVGVHIAAYSGTLMLILMYLALVPPENNPVVDDHIVYSVVLVGLAWARAGRTWGLGAWWARRGIVKRHPILE